MQTRKGSCYCKADASFQFSMDFLAWLSIPSLVVLLVPKMVIIKIHSILATFLWGESQGKTKKKWGAWSKLCKLVDEGGIDVRELSEAQKAFFWKFSWRLISMDNWQIRFFLAKYVNNDHILNTKPTQTGSWLWKEILKVFPKVYDNYCVKVKDSQCSFWYDKWLNS